METAITIAIIGVMNILSFTVGAKVGQRVSKGQPVEVPIPHPIKAIHEPEDKREARQEQKRIEAIMRNIARYDGTSNGQEDVK